MGRRSAGFYATALGFFLDFVVAGLQTRAFLMGFLVLLFSLGSRGFRPCVK
jgi:hypothetical protein